MEKYISSKKNLDKLIQNSISFGRCLGLSKIGIAIPMVIDHQLANEIFRFFGAAGIIVTGIGNQELFQYKDKTGYFIQNKYIWSLPRAKLDSIIYLGPSLEISFRMGLVALSGRCHDLIFLEEGAWKKQSIVIFLFNRIVERLLEKIITTKRFLIEKIFSIINFVIKLLFRMIGFVLKQLNRSNHVYAALREVYEKLRILLRKAEDYLLNNKIKQQLAKLVFSPEQPLLNKDQFIAGRILHVNSALATGGAERQIVNTIIGTINSGLHDVSLICERLHEFEGSDFYLEKLKSKGVKVENLRSRVIEMSSDIDRLSSLIAALNKIPQTIRPMIINYIYEFYERRPEVVHLWQDSTNILAGIAACIVGVPKIILCARNMAPYRFLYFQAYMKAGYQVLGNHPSVKFINNSYPGKKDYVDWLGIPEDKITVVLNGLYKADITEVGESQTIEYRNKLGLPDDVLVIGSIFRLYYEKDPMLWIETAAEIVKRSRDKKIIFLLIGEGPMMDSFLKTAEKLGVSEKLFLPGNEKDPSIALSLFDLFLLTSINEGTPNVVIEAQYCGVPVIATNVGGTIDTIEHGVTGHVMDSRDPKLIAKKVLEILGNEVWLSNARKCAPLLAEKKFGIDRMIDEMLSIYGYSNNSQI